MELHLLDSWLRTDSGREKAMVFSCLLTGACTTLQWTAPNQSHRQLCLYIGGYKTK